MSENPNPWIDAFLAKLELIIELQSSGALDIQYAEGELVISPEVLELVRARTMETKCFPSSTLS